MGRQAALAPLFIPRRLHHIRRMQDTPFLPDSAPGEDRPAKPAAIRGFKRRCPNCGQGALFDGYLKVARTCPTCGEELHHHRADDGPAYMTILIVGHLLAPTLLIVFTKLRPDPMVTATFFTIGTVALSLYLLPRLKGMLVGIQWAKRMHGFGKSG